MANFFISMKPGVILAAPNLEKKTNIWDRLYFAANLLANSSTSSTSQSFSDSRSSTSQTDTSGSSSCTSQYARKSNNRNNFAIFEDAGNRFKQEAQRQYNLGQTNLSLAGLCGRILHNTHACENPAPSPVNFGPPQVTCAPPQVTCVPPQVNFAAPQVNFAAPQVNFAAPQVVYSPQQGRPTYITGRPAQPNYNYPAFDFGYRYKPNNLPGVPQLAPPYMASPVFTYCTQPARTSAFEGPLGPIYRSLALTGIEYNDMGKKNFDRSVMTNLGADICKFGDANIVRSFLECRDNMFPSAAR